MVDVNSFTIEKVNESYVVKGMGYYQNIDFVNGGNIDTLEKAEAIRQALVDNINNAENQKTTLEQEIIKLKEDNANINYTLMMGGLL